MTQGNPAGCGCGRAASRRYVLAGLGAAAAFPLVGCAGGEPPIEFVDEETVSRMGLETWQQIRRQEPLSDDRQFRQSLQRASTRLLRAADESPGAWEVRAFAGEQINAFAVPGRKIGVYEGMYELTENEAQLAAVVGHEIAHVLEDHAQDRANASILRDLGLELSRAALSAGDVTYAREIAALMGVGAEVGVTLPFSRAHEREADRLGVTLMQRAGYDPYAAVRLWERMAERGGGQIDFLSTHPAAEDRAGQLREFIRQEYG